MSASYGHSFTSVRVDLVVIYDQLEEIPDIYLLTPIYVLLVRLQSQFMVTQSTFYAHFYVQVWL